VLDKVVGYGYSPWRALIPMTAFILFGWLLFAAADRYGHMVPAKERVYMDREYKDTHVLPTDYPHLQPLVYSIDLFLPFVDLHQEDYWTPTDQRGQNRRLGHFAKVWRWVHIGLGWVLSALFVAGITGLVKRE
jgi:hypothetical protein